MNNTIKRYINEECIQKEYQYKEQTIIEFNYWDEKPYYWCIKGWEIVEVISFKNPQTTADTQIEIRSAIMPDGIKEYGISCSLFLKPYYYRYPGTTMNCKYLSYEETRKYLLQELIYNIRKERGMITELQRIIPFIEKECENQYSLF